MSNLTPEEASGLPQENPFQLSLAGHFAGAASQVLSQVAGSALEVTPEVAELAAEAATLLHVEISGALEGAFEVALTAPMTARFAALLVGEPFAAEITDESREAAAELLRQICGSAADRLRAAYGPLELKARIAGHEPQGRAEEAAGLHQRLRIHRGEAAADAEPFEMDLHILRLQVAAQAAAAASAEESRAHSAAQETKAPASVTPAEPRGETAAGTGALATAQQPGNRNLDLLLDFELGVTLRFGSRQMLLKDILELCSGSVVELDRRVEEPVDLLIDGRVIARGEVVIVEGNYGLRILQVASQGEKLACLP